MKIGAVFFINLLVFFTAGAQQLKLQEVQGLPTKEIYDLYLDRKGYLWIAHDLGISRFDGLNFIHFSSQGQASLSMTDITEDNQGKIWCHNFSGQIFYIEKGQMNILKSYNYEKELQYPRIAICGDELVATSDHGLFVCSTIDFSSRYIPVSNSSLTSLSAISNRAVLFDNENWFVYEHRYGIKKLKQDGAIVVGVTNRATLQPVNFGNLLYLISNPSGIVQKIALRGDSLISVSKYELKDFINAVSISEQTWIHTRNKSKTLDGKWSIEGQSLTDAVKDKEGNTWFSSLKKGLLVSYKKAQWEVINPLADKEDFVRCLNVADGYFFGGSNKGNLFVFDSILSKINWEMRLFDGFGSIEFIRFFKNHRFVAGTSINTYIVNPVERKVENLLPLSAVKDVDFDRNTLYLATVNGFYMMPYLDSISLPEWQQEKHRQFPFIRQHPDTPYLFTHQRTRALRNDVLRNSVFVSLKNGLHQVNKKGIVPFLINRKEVFTSSMWYKSPRLFIATFNDGLWIKTDTVLQHFTTSNFLNSNTILRTKATQNHLWLFENESMQVLDIETGALLKDIELPKVNGANVFDVAEWQGYGYLTTSEGIYKIPMAKGSEERALTGFLDAVIADNKDSLFQSAMAINYNKNDLQFIFSSPAYYDPNTISFRYRLAGADRDWQTTRPGERSLRYASLPPGTYTLHAYAINKNGIRQADEISFSIVINKPWWQQYWFYALCFIGLTAIIYFIDQYRVRQLLKVEQIRRKISTDLHDDIGATLSSINIYTELAKKERMNDTYFEAIQDHSNEVISKLDDLIWSINPRYDNFEQLVNRMHSYADPLLQAKKISVRFRVSDELLKERLLVQTKQNLYLVFKELINNVVKHSEATECRIDLSCRDNIIYLVVMDNGRGFDISNIKKDRHGVGNMKLRIESIKGRLQIESGKNEGTTIMATIPLPKNYFSSFKQWCRKIFNR